MMVKVNEVAVEKEFEVFVDLNSVISLTVKAINEEEAVEKAKLNEEAILQLIQTLVLHNGEVRTVKTHDFNTGEINVFGEDE
jgi:hypothetical protein